MADTRERTRVVRKHPHLNTSSPWNPALSEGTENDEKQTHISFVDWLNEMDAQVSKTDNSNNPFKCSTTPCPTSFSVSRPTCCYETLLSQQTARATNPFISGVENEYIHGSGINAQCYTQSTPANLNYPHSMCTELTAKRMLQGTPTIYRQPCKHDVCAAQHSIREDEGNTMYSNGNECCLPELTRSSQRGRKPRRKFCDLSSDSGEECNDHRERIPTLRPGQFDGSTSWREFLNRFEDCARANHWSERTMTVQIRFCLVGAAGAVIHKNPRSSRWDYARIVEEVEAAYGPSSEHAAAIGIELRQKVRRAGEPLHVLRDDIYEKVSIAYADRSEREQDSISVEVFTNAMGDADIVQRLLEERPRTLARAYEIAHRYETTRRTATSVTQLMQSAIRPMERRTRAAAVRECPDQSGSDKESSVPSTPERRQRNSKAEFKPRPQKFNKKNKINWEEIVCHNCQGIGHMRQNYPSPRLNLERVTPPLPRLQSSILPPQFSESRGVGQKCAFICCCMTRKSVPCWTAGPGGACYLGSVMKPSRLM